MTIAFVHTQKAFLPGIDGYVDFFSKYNIRCEVVDRQELPKLPRQVEWFFMGADRMPKSKEIVRIHEYISPSIPPFSNMKNVYKKWFNIKPDLRIFKNEQVRHCFGFNDEIPFLYMDIGIPDAWLLQETTAAKQYDFIYVGDLAKHRNPEVLIAAFTQPHLQQHTLLLLSSNYEQLQSQYRQYKNIIFKGPVSKQAVNEYIRSAKFAINYIPDKAPFNILTSTKLLEYAACRVPVISTDYAWVRQFQQRYGGNYFYVANDLSNLTWESVNNFNYIFPDLSEWTWEKQIRKSGILEFLEKKFGDLGFSRADRG